MSKGWDVLLASIHASMRTKHSNYLHKHLRSDWSWCLTPSSCHFSVSTGFQSFIFSSKRGTSLGQQVLMMVAKVSLQWLEHRFWTGERGSNHHTEWFAPACGKWLGSPLLLLARMVRQLKPELDVIQALGCLLTSIGWGGAIQCNKHPGASAKASLLPLFAATNPARPSSGLPTSRNPGSGKHFLLEERFANMELP